MNHKTNRRAQKTKIILQNTLVELLNIKSVKTITVTEITEKANIHRGTFYLHYKDIYDLFDSIEKSFLYEYKNNEKVYLGKNPLDWEAFFINLFEYFLYKSDVLKVILSTNQSKLLDEMIELTRPNNFEEWIERYSVGNKDNYLYYYNALSQSMRALIQTWCKNDCKLTPHEMVLISQNILRIYGAKNISID